MINAYYNFVHGIGLHLWDIPAILVLVIMIVVFIVHKNNQKKREEDFQNELDKKIQEIKEGTVVEETQKA